MTDKCAACGVTPEQVAADHAFLSEFKSELQLFLEERRRSRERWERFRQSAFGAAAVVAVGGVATLLHWLGGLIFQALEQGKHP